MPQHGNTEDVRLRGFGPTSTRSFRRSGRNGDNISVLDVSSGCANVRLHADDKHLRPGGTVKPPHHVSCLPILRLTQ